MQYDWRLPVYADMRDNEPMIELYADNVATLGRQVFDPKDAPAVVGSTDMGNVSYEVPSIHPMIRVSPPNISIHTPEFAEFARGPVGDEAVLDGAKAMAMTIADLWLRPDALAEVKRAFSNAESD
jgi:metal-dependent amidase/aminoacylase/carboxypeptidase family protein